MKRFEVLLALAEEEPPNLMVIQTALQEKGYGVTVETADTSDTEKMEVTRFDLVITDLLPILKRTKELNPKIIAILVLATRSKSIPTVHAIRSSADDYLFRPFGLAELEMRVAHCAEKLGACLRDPQPDPDALGMNEKVLAIVKAMSHDVRGSLLSISATLKLLSRGYYGKMDDAVVGRIKELFSKTSGLIGLTEEYLGRSFSVDEDLEDETRFHDLMKDILIPVLKELSPELKGHHLLIDHRLHAMSNRPIPIRTSRILLKMVFRNLLANAIKYGDRDGTIVLGFEDQGSFYRMNVYNNGNPIPEEYRERLFTRFMGDGTEQNGKERGGGMGLGLYLIKRIIQKLGGRIWYEAKENGSNFIFTIPSKSHLREVTLSPSPTPPIRAHLQPSTLNK